MRSGPVTFRPSKPKRISAWVLFGAWTVFGLAGAVSLDADRGAGITMLICGATLAGVTAPAATAYVTISQEDLVSRYYRRRRSARSDIFTIEVRERHGFGYVQVGLLVQGREGIRPLWLTGLAERFSERTRSRAASAARTTCRARQSLIEGAFQTEALARRREPQGAARSVSELARMVRPPCRRGSGESSTLHLRRRERDAADEFDSRRGGAEFK